MSRQATDWAWSTDLKWNEKFLLIVLANYADEDWSCYPGMDRLARDIGSTRSTVVRLMKRLEEGGYVSRIRRSNANGYRTSNRYWLQDPKSQAATKGLSSNHAAPMSQTRRDLCSTLIQEPTEEPKENQSEDIRASAVKPEVEEAFETVWKAWPKKTDRKDAYAKFQSTYRKHFAQELDTLVGHLLAHAEAYRKFRPDPTYVPAMAVWLNKRRWEDPPITGPSLRPAPGRAPVPMDWDAIDKMVNG